MLTIYEKSNNNSHERIKTRVNYLNGSYEKILTLTELEEGNIHPVSWELLNIANELSVDSEGEVHSVLIGHNIEEAAEKIRNSADKVHVIDQASFEIINPDLQLEILTELSEQIDPGLILLEQCCSNESLAPRLSYRLGGQLTTNCIDLSLDPENESLQKTKKIYGRTVSVTLEDDHKPQVITVKRRAAKPLKDSLNRKGEINTFNINIDEYKPKMGIIETKEEETELKEADIIVAAGRGLKGPEEFDEVKELANILKDALGGSVAVGATKPICKAGWIPLSHQIGLTGQRISPDLYIAIGISGAIHHLASIRRSNIVVAMNNDPDAPIFKEADYGLIGDYAEILPILKNKIKEKITLEE